MEESDRLLSANAEMGDDEESLRPQTLDEYIGQDTLKENLRIYIQAALQRMNLWIMFFCMVLQD